MDGNVIAENKASSDVRGISAEIVVYGASGDMWGTSLTLNDLDDHEFGVRIQVKVDCWKKNAMRLLIKYRLTSVLTRNLLTE